MLCTIMSSGKAHFHTKIVYIDGLVQERRNPGVLAMGLRIFLH